MESNREKTDPEPPVGFCGEQILWGLPDLKACFCFLSELAFLEEPSASRLGSSRTVSFRFGVTTGHPGAREVRPVIPNRRHDGALYALDMSTSNPSHWSFRWSWSGPAAKVSSFPCPFGSKAVKAPSPPEARGINPALLRCLLRGRSRLVRRPWRTTLHWLDSPQEDHWLRSRGPLGVTHLVTHLVSVRTEKATAM